MSSRLYKETMNKESITLHTRIPDLPAEFFEAFKVWKAVKQAAES